MQVIKEFHFVDDFALNNHQHILRPATRAIVTRGQQVLLLHTERYRDYSLPGGGVDHGESLQQALIRELKEETGAREIDNITPYGLIREFRANYKQDGQIIEMLSYCFTCEIDNEFDQQNLEDYEIANGMTVHWVDIEKAIAYNKQTMAESEKKGISIVRETFLLEHIAKNLLNLTLD
ncbi:NUDIX hydrolase [Pseudoalteromonas piratica]|uniref:DNA mismatch repair protein MutT n=1 Tax=Pseudoalteromonas piratica TaxID=1348114 RepID=A0A0A7EEE2_9GAMM|nr:NUDIX domain-containing protein [Pseudoalteromonas piratica]AIY64969.1 DNA mismatch repair protein MutT [Pseudoalteromonas piratica]